MNAPILGATGSFIELDKVTHSYGCGPNMVHALAETTLEIAQGDFVALLEPFGYGNSMTLTGTVRRHA
jgi:NitT/TauT family transport system ATP-binding protein